jgi:hypothetical protein
MSTFTRTPTDYAAYIRKARLLRAEALAAALADLRRWLRVPLRAGGWMRMAGTR